MGSFGRVMVALLLCGAAAGAQTGFATDVLVNAPLVVWVVLPAPPAQPTADQVRATLHTSTAGRFGQTAGSVGQTAGTYQGTTDSRATTALSTGASQTAGSFGHGLDTIAGAGAPSTTPAFEPAALGPEWTGFRARMGRFGSRMQLVAVQAADLQDRMAYVFQALPAQFPDVLIGNISLVAANPFLQPLVLRKLGWQGPDPSLPDAGSRPRFEALITAAAAHPAQARAFAVWLSDHQQLRAEVDGLRDVEAAKIPDAVRGMAVAAAGSLLAGVKVPGADPSFVRYDPSVAQSRVMQAPGAALAGLQLRLDVLSAHANERLAVFELRAIAGSEQAFGVVYPTVVMRRNDKGLWRVLQVTGDRDRREDHASAGPLWTFAAAMDPRLVRPVSAVRLAAPPDGDTRAGLPELWWDNPGSAGLLVVEWSRDDGDSHMYFVPDDGQRLQVRVTAGFAGVPGGYRWRVWTLGKGGTLALSPWRVLSVLPSV